MMQHKHVWRFAAGRRRSARIAGIGILATSLAVLGGASQAEATAAPSRHFTKAPAGSVVTKLPLGLSNAMTTLVVQMAGDPLTVADADATTPLTADQKRTRRNELRSKQDTAETQVRKLGGTVVAKYQTAYNGMKIRIQARQAPALLNIPNVVGVHRLQQFEPDNVHGVPLVGAPAAWDGTAGFHGEGIKVGIIDTGIDYTHADFGGPGTVAAYDTAHAAETSPADPALFGPGAPKVKGGIDLVGDTYQPDDTAPDFQPNPVPDSNPLDCNGHGSHVAGTAAGFGVLGDGTTYTGPYNASTVSGHSWIVGPGVAPKADLYAIRVFGCEGPTNEVLDAIEWAVNNDMDVINMSLGSPFGSADDPSAVAATNAARDGVIVVTSSGNSGQNPYMTGSPGTGTGVISTAALDPTPSFPGAHLAPSTGGNVDAIVANGPMTLPASLPVKVLRTATGAISLGCNEAEYAGTAGMLVVTTRGTCARVARAVFGQKAGAAAVLMVNSSDTLPPFEGPITGNPDPGGEHLVVTIPFLGVKSSDGAAIVAADGKTISLSAFDLPNPGYLAPASFTSAGPRTGDSALKPDVTAPGVSIFSAGVGTGNGSAALSGTSMASPHTTGMAALVRQAHPTWNRVAYWKAAVVNTADPAKVNGYSTRVAGTGLIQAVGATRTQVVALGDPGTATLNYGFAELGHDYNVTKTITLRNFSNKSVKFNVAAALPQGSTHIVSLSRSSVTVPARDTADVRVTLRVPAATAGTATNDADLFADVAGLVTFTPVNGANNGVALKVPYYLVPQAVSNVTTSIDTLKLGLTGTATAKVTNRNGAVTGAADWYAWGLSDPRERDVASNDVRAVGVQSFPTDGVLAFGISTQQRWSNPSMNEFDVYVDVNRDGTDDYDVVGVDLGAVTTGDFTGQMAVAVFDLASGAGSIQFLADAPFDSTSMVLPVLFDQLCTTETACLSGDNPRFNYHAVSFGITDETVDEVDGVASFNAFAPAISNGMFDVVAPNGSATETVTVNKTEFAQTPALGLLILSHDNTNGMEAQAVRVRVS